MYIDDFIIIITSSWVPTCNVQHYMSKFNAVGELQKNRLLQGTKNGFSWGGFFLEGSDV